MKKLLRSTVMCGCLFWPVLAYAGEKEVKAVFLLQGGIGGILIGAGLYAAFMVLSAMFFRKKTTVATLFVLCVAFYIYMQYQSIYFLAIALHFMRTRQMQYEFGELTSVLIWVLLLIGIWGLAVFGIALRMWTSRNRVQKASSLSGQ
ncbi:hypothetical protein [Hymenobacter volaticus]|uniref:DUF4293 family protein n=1 Tax=Hymenobacter volaticus TaxID=2932254 RepID=A0ABY4G6W0_9BACT|nr:hypothetical protein [Hymenobacter volaticus]UOQ66543.1 hypothetical protein MUN86_01005 [Hymenobacter volaticus]